MGIETVVAAGLSAYGSSQASKASRKASKAAQMIVPDMVNTGYSTYDPQTGTASLDPSIRSMQDDLIGAQSGFKTDVGSMFDSYNTGLEGLQGQVDTMRADYMGNQSNYREAMLNPVREAIARREGSLDKELGRTKVRGSFAQGARTNLALDSARALSDREAQVENDRINRLGDFLNMDADILKQGLASDQGRLSMLQSIEQSLSGISMDRFNQEMQLLGLPAQFVPGATSAAAITSNAAAMEGRANTQYLGKIFSAAGDYDGGSTDPFFTTDSSNMNDTWENW